MKSIKLKYAWKSVEECEQANKNPSWPWKLNENKYWEFCAGASIFLTHLTWKIMSAVVTFCCHLWTFKWLQKCYGYSSYESIVVGICLPVEAMVSVQ
jgi:hypothetical protein